MEGGCRRGEVVGHGGRERWERNGKKDGQMDAMCKKESTRKRCALVLERN
jgi:hypothetical protein